MSLPAEVMEIILIEAIAAFRTVYGVHLMIRRVDVLSFVNVLTVCNVWHRVICGRRRNRERIRRIFKQKVTTMLDVQLHSLQVMHKDSAQLVADFRINFTR